jgi:hypothetical protein
MVMVKDMVHERESAVKKRRKGGNSSTSTSPAKVPERDIYKVRLTKEERLLYALWAYRVPLLPSVKRHATSVYAPSFV